MNTFMTQAYRHLTSRLRGTQFGACQHQCGYFLVAWVNYGSILPTSAQERYLIDWSQTQKLHKDPDLQMQALSQLVASVTTRSYGCNESEDDHALVEEVKQLVSELLASVPQAGQIPRPSLLPLKLPSKKSVCVPWGKQKHTKPPDPTQAPTLIPATATTLALIPVFTALSALEVSKNG